MQNKEEILRIRITAEDKKKLKKLADKSKKKMSQVIMELIYKVIN